MKALSRTIAGNNHVRNCQEKGQSLVEFAFGLVILMILISGIVDLGRAFFTYMALNDAAQEAPSMDH